MNIEFLRYPIGQCKYQTDYSKDDVEGMLLDMETFPSRLQNMVEDLSDEQLNTAYRPGGWTVRQVIHHCADSHINALVRIKLALATDNPVINPYPEDKWANMIDYTLPIHNSIALLLAVHAKLNVILRTLQGAQWQRTYVHPQYEKTFRMLDVLCLYAWHGNHHLAHINLVANK